LSADLPDDQMNNSLLPDMRALDAALREVLNATPQERRAPHDAAQHEVAHYEAAQQGVSDDEDDRPLALEETMDVVSRAASAIDELVERNRSITNAAVRSVEFFRAQASEARAEADRLREELRVLKSQSEAQRVAALAQAQELEAELAARTIELEKANTWIGEIRSQVESLLGNAETRLADTTADSLFAG
jgi:hypothetical protein